MIAVIDYGVGNLKSIENAIKFNNSDVKVDLVSEPENLKKYEKIILPGVGAFGDAIEKIREKNFDQAIFEEVKKGKFLLGICLGMQLLATKSYEYGEHLGLNLIDGEVILLKNINNIRIPHMGWNNVTFSKNNKILSDINNLSDFYFLHSYHFSCSRPDYILGITDYGLNFISVINKDNIYGAQFHPEKSQENGLKFMKNFIEL